MFSYQKKSAKLICPEKLSLQICFHIKEIVDITFICEKVEPGFRFGFSAVQPQDDAGVGGHHHHPGDQHNHRHRQRHNIVNLQMMVMIMNDTVTGET